MRGRKINTEGTQVRARRKGKKKQEEECVRRRGRDLHTERASK